MRPSQYSGSERSNILHLVPSIRPQSGGLVPVVINLVREQRMLGYQAEIWSLDPYTCDSEVVKESEFKEGTINTFPVSGPAQVGFSRRMQRAAKSGKGERYSILHQHGIWMATSLVTNGWRMTFGRPTVVAPHGSLEDWALKRSVWKKRLASLFYEKRNLAAASCLHATSLSEATSLRDYGLRNPIAIIPNGIPESWIHSNSDSARFRNQFCIPAGNRLLLFLSRIHPKKGIPLLFEAMNQIKQQLRDWLLVVAGPSEGNYLNEIQSLARRFNIENMVHFVGPLFGQEKRDAYAAADLFVLPTHSENFGIVIAEALGASVPVLTTRGAPWAELVTYGCGWWVEISTGAIRDALLDAIQLPRDELRMMGRSGKSLINDKYTWPLLGRQSIALYSWLLGEGERPDFVIMD